MKVFKTAKKLKAAAGFVSVMVFGLVGGPDITAFAAVAVQNGWTVEEMSGAQDTAPTARYCMAKAEFVNGDSLVIARDLAGSLSGAFQRVHDFTGPGQKYDLGMAIDGQEFRSFKALAVNQNTVLFQIAHDYDFVESLRAGYDLTLSVADEKVTLSLNGSASAIDRLNACLKTANNGRALGWEAASGIIPPYVPGMMRGNFSTGHQFSALAHPVTNHYSVFNDPTRSYIKVHYPQPAGLGESRKPEPAKDMSYKGLICRADEANGISVLRPYIDKRLAARIELASGQELQEDAAGFKPLEWTHDNIKAHAALVSKPRHIVQQNVLQDLKAACSGDFAMDEISEKASNGLTVEDYNVACFTGADGLMGSIRFISDGFDTAIFSFEAAPEAFDKALDEKNIVTGDI